MRPLVDLEMGREVAVSSKPALATSTHKSLVSIMRPRVVLYMTAGRENFGAELARKQITSSLYVRHALLMSINFVSYFVSISGKALAAQLAGKRLEMCPRMFFETFGRNERLADRTRNILLQMFTLGLTYNHFLLGHVH